jgi:hypothetical protein
VMRGPLSKLYMAEWPERQRRCETRSVPPGERCPEVAKYVLILRDRDSAVCEPCMATWVTRLTLHGPITVERIR